MRAFCLATYYVLQSAVVVILTVSGTLDYFLCVLCGLNICNEMDRKEHKGKRKERKGKR